MGQPVTPCYQLGENQGFIVQPLNPSLTTETPPATQEGAPEALESTISGCPYDRVSRLKC